MENKADLRRRLKLRRDEMDDALRATLSEQIASHALGCVVERGASMVGLYASIISEVDTASLFNSLSGRADLVFPRVHREGGLEFVRVERLESLAPGAFGVPEPRGPAVPLSEIGCLFVPGLGFDHRGGRLGYGGGYYDRVLPQVSGRAYGLGFDLQVVEALPLQEHDHLLSGLVTESGVMEFQK